jgi:hypothetical protein
LAISIGEAKTKTFDVGDGLENDDHRKSNAPGLSAEEQAKIKVRVQARLDMLNMLLILYAKNRRRSKTQRRWMRCSD